MKLYILLLFFFPLVFSNFPDPTYKEKDDPFFKKIKHVETVYGGCNNRRSINNESKEEIEETCIQLIKNDSLSFIFQSIIYVVHPSRHNLK